jgi:class 3 adenylate cyclase/tetratricopeptide (TPR) repeat protein
VIPAPIEPASRFASPQQYTPKHLAEKILISRSALTEERKQVTVLFVDVVGSTAIAEKLDPEEMHRILDQAFELILKEIHEYEGTVTQFLGDGLMALFGAPVAHEDHAVRAVHAALGIQRAASEYGTRLRDQRGIEFKIRIGLNTGLVVVGAIGNDLRMDYTAIGDTTNLAARMQQHAAPATVLLAKPTYRLISGYFETRPVGPLNVKGKSEPIQAYEVLGARRGRTRLDLAAERGLTPYFGRDRELHALSECFEKVKAGRGQVVFIVGEPGIGKSRLLFEFRRRLGEEATWLEGHCISFGRSIAFYPLIDLLKRNFGVEESDTEETIVSKIERGVLLISEELRPTLRYIRYLLSVDPGDAAVLSMDPQLRRGEIFEALRRLLLRAAELRPQVVVFEDLHWMDKATEESLQLIADSIAASRVLLILTYRPDYHQPFGERTYHARIAPDNLSTEASIQMAHAMLAAEKIPEEVKELIVKKAEGNPFFVEEVVKSLQEIGVLQRVEDGFVLARRLDSIFVPDTIQDVIMARIDRLDEAPKKTLQLASVIGREFTRRLLDRLGDLQERHDELLKTLKAIELIHEKSIYPELAYMFKHALTHEVAYNSLLVQRRKELHGFIARAIEELYADRLGEHYEVLAYHFSRAEECEQALEYSLKAAEKATQAFATREAVALYDQALKATEMLGDAAERRTLMAIHQAKSNLYFVLSDFEQSRAEGERLLDLARQSGDRVSEGAALAGMGFASLWAHSFDRALDYSREAIEVAAATDAKPVLAGAHFVTGFVYGVTARLDRAGPELEQALKISHEAGDVLHESLSLCFIGLATNWAGDYVEASRFLSEGLRIARHNNLLVPLLYGLFMHGVTLTGKGDYGAALSTFEEGLALSEKVGDEVQRHRMLNCLGWLHMECGDLDRAIDLNRRGAEGARKRADPETIANPEINLGDIFLEKGDLTLAHEFLDGVYRLVKNPGTSEWMKWRYSTHLFASLGDLWLARGDYTKAGEFAGQCLDIARRTNSRKNLVKGLRLQGEIAMARRQWDDAEGALRQALTIAETVGNPTQLWKTYLAAGRLKTHLKKHDEAGLAFQKAREVVDPVRTNFQNPALRTSFERSPIIQQVYNLNDAGHE